jgi:hypothetical protein
MKVLASVKKICRNCKIIRRNGATPGTVTHANAFSNGTINGLKLTIATDLTIEGAGAEVA